MKSWFKFLLYVSLVFLAIALYNADYLKIPRIFSVFALTLSFVFLFAGFIFNAISWNQVLRVSKYPIRLGECVAGFGLSIFGKYIPGKIWMIVGRAAYITEENRYPLGTLSAISLHTQLIAIWFGLIYGLSGLYMLGGSYLWSWLLLALWLVLTVVIFSNFVHAKAEQGIRLILRKDITLPKLTVKSTFSVMPAFIAYWAFWSIAYYLLVTSLIEIKIPWSVGLGFPLAGTLGIITFISPGGLGTREAVMVGYLALAGLPVVDATTVAVASRLWFIVGEVFIFFIGWITHRQLHKPVPSSIG